MNATPSHRPSRVVRVLRKLTDAKTSKTTIAAAISVAVAAWLSFGMLALSSDHARLRVGLLPPIWLLAAFAVVAISAVKALRVSERTSSPLFLSWLIVPAWLPLPVPDVLLTWSGPAVVSVWTAIVFSVIAVARPRFGRLAFLFISARTGAYTATALAFVAFLVVRLGALPPPTGDEPHYLVLTESLVHDRDVKVRNNYERADYLEYYGGYLRPHIPNPDDARQLYSLHSPGIAVIIAPAFAIAGYWAVVFWLAALTALGTGLVWKIGCLHTKDIGAAWFGWAVVTLTVPLALQATLVYPDSLAGVIMALGTFMLTRLDIPTSTAAPIGNPKTLQMVSQPRIFRLKPDTARVVQSRLCWALLGCGAAMAFLPWFHPRLAVPALILAAALLVRIASRSRGPMRVVHLAALVVPLALGSGAWLAFSYAIYGSLDPRALYGRLSFSQLASGLPALLGDQEFGLLPNAPVHLVSVAGLWAAFKRDRRFGAELLLLVVPYIIVLGTWREWWGGSAPPARFLLPVMFPLGAAAANLWASHSNGIGR